MPQQQSKAAIAAIANSIEKFAVTPERLRAEFERNYELLWKRIDERFNAVDQRFKANDERFKSVEGRLDRIESLMEKMIGWMATFFVTFIVGLMGLFGTLVVGIWPLA